MVMQRKSVNSSLGHPVPKTIKIVTTLELVGELYLYHNQASLVQIFTLLTNRMTEGRKDLYGKYGFQTKNYILFFSHL